MTRFTLTFAVTVLGFGSAHATTDCGTLAALRSDGAGADIAERHPDWLTDASCRAEALGTGQNGVICFWEHGYREGAARAQFDTVRGELEACLANDQTVVADTAVNHPDTYVLEDFVFDDAVISLSLKDKATLGKSFVFLRMR